MSRTLRARCLLQPGVLVVKRHHVLVRWSHWLNVPLTISGISIYWASPIDQRELDPVKVRSTRSERLSYRQNMEQDSLFTFKTG